MSAQTRDISDADMSRQRALPEQKNPLLEPEHSPQYEILVERRCHAQTNLIVRPGLVGTSNATKAENLHDRFDYVHLRAPLPKDLTGSEIFSAAGTAPVPPSYFLMRRSDDGFVSATGMFKASFPWATKNEEQAERKYIKSLPTTDPQEVAGNLWVPPEFALDLAEDYGILHWIQPLLDNEPVELYSGTGGHGPHRIDHGPKPITSPPPFNMPPRKQQSGLRAPSRELRSASPTKMPAPPTPGRPKKTPRKPRAKKVVTAAPSSSVEATPSVADSVADSAEDMEPEPEAEPDELSMEPVAEAKEVDDDDQPVEEENAPAPIADDDDDEEPLADNNVRVSVQEEIKDDGVSTTTHTTVKVQLPASSPDLKLPTDTEGVVEMAKEIIESVKEMEASKIEASASDLKPAGGGSKKRSRDEYEEDLADELDDMRDEMEQVKRERDMAMETRPTKRTRLMVPAEEYRKEKVKKRALMGLSGALAFALIIPSISAFWL